MKLSLKYSPRWTEEQRSIIAELSFHTTKLYNIANYHCRESKYLDYVTLEKDLKSNWHNDYLHSHSYQHCLRVMDQNWKSYFQSVQDFRKNPGKYKGMPQPPGYKNVDKHPNEVIFTYAAIRRRDGHLLLSLSKAMQEKFQVDSLKVKEALTLPLPEQARLQQIRLQYDRTKQEWCMLIIYKITEKQTSKAPHIMAIDLGVDNLATITFSHSTDSYILCGRTLKSINGYIHQKIAHLQSIRMKQVGSASFRSSRQIRRLRKKRRDTLTDALHQASRTVMKLAEQYDIGLIVMGDIKGIKQDSPLKTFVQIPIQQLSNMIAYKAQIEGISVRYEKEHYTSGVSAFDLEPIDATHYNKARRITRGLFRTNQGILVNADVNGSLNILRKAYTGIPYLITSVRDNGCVNHPQRIRVAWRSIIQVEA